mmetsp:Transcript_137/g.202  ORF Transcript_137/g.202 Transcript_137/m.202 type:complete len:554 (-) Transcript_137:161-1822(-)|eukprot:CAMPEP_0178408282 /NCGR_PEP_ID=MMETSP0689_2-20121128/19860_1 /TAXON_ID=160604 /ORGANISM="Amphidinium massartii, Strain CS-259" /LENGTH=553 /DNA_ID=CAMNT_0020029375 /DNA_START=53 /DNA_END=1714 /DNA_ORIENTATION=+
MAHSKSAVVPATAALAAAGVGVMAISRSGGAFATMPGLRGTHAPATVIEEAVAVTEGSTSASPAAPLSAGVSAVGATAAVALGLRAANRKRRSPKVSRRVATLDSVDTDASMSKENEALVNKKSVLVLGATGTLGRQVVRQFIDAGYTVKCLIREKEDRPFSYLTDWGATLIQGSLVAPESLPAALIGVHTVVDCATARTEDPTYEIDWKGKKTFIQCCEAMKIQRYIFCSIKDCDKYTNVPLMNMKYQTEQFLKKTSMRTTNVRITGFFQPLIPQFAFSILDDQEVWGDDGSTSGIAYVDSQDCARFVLAAASKDRTIGKTVTVSGPKVWSTTEVIKLCESMSGKSADVKSVPSAILKVTEIAASSFLWGIDVAERLRFAEAGRNDEFSSRDVMTQETYDLLGLKEDQTRTLEDYFKEYYRRMFKRITQGEFIPEEGEVERLKKEEDEKTALAAAKPSDDYVPEGVAPEEQVTVLEQREMANRLFDFFVLKRAEDDGSDEKQWFGLSPIAEIINGRSAMMGISLGLFTEWATDVSVTRQCIELYDILAGVPR